MLSQYVSEVSFSDRTWYLHVRLRQMRQAMAEISKRIGDGFEEPNFHITLYLTASVQ